ncbi:MAG: thiamine pyrophosphate-dependent dehydrogenase E1 component subunit alpha [Desulfovibrionales bacterium]
MAEPLQRNLRIALYESMVLIRTFENRLITLTKEGERLPGMQILANGQEAVAAGVVMALQQEDILVTNHRSHGHLLARGADPGHLLAEIMGRENGVNHGKAGTLHLAVPELGAVMTSTVVGASPPLAVGAAFAQQYRGDSGITVVFFGDGAAAEGSVHEAMNMAGVWKLPVLFVCENNCWAGAQAYAAHCSAGQIAHRAAGYGMEGRFVDGNDVEEVFQTTRELAREIRKGGGPALMEALTYRMRGHGERDTQHYVDPEELVRWSKLCPVQCYGRKLVEEGVLQDSDLKAVRKEMEGRVEGAEAFADMSPFPAAEAALDHVWVDEPADFRTRSRR